MTGGSNANDFYALTINNEVCIGRFGGGDTCSGSGTISTNTWYNLVITYDGTNARLYLNGILKATVARTYTTAGTGYLLIGKDYVQYDQFSGKIDEVSVWNRELSLGEISAAYTASTTPYVGNESGLVSLLHFDESVYNSVTDSSGQSRTGTGTGTFTSTMSAVTGNAFLFNGSNSDISVPGYSVSTSSQTVSMWVKLTPGWSSGNQYFLFNEGDSQQLQITLNNYCAGTSPSNNLCPSIYSGGGAGGGSINPNVRIGDDNWHHIALVDQANVGYLYVDGVLALSRSLAFSGSTGGLHIGNYQNGSFFSPVSMDEVAIWNRALSPTEIATIYAKQSFTIGIVGNSHSFNLSNITVGGPITSTGATIHLTNATTSRITVSGADATGNAQAGGTITLVNSSTGDLFANGGNSTDYGYGGAAGVVTKDANSSYTSKTNNAGSNGPNLASGQQTGTGVNVVLGCTDPTASNYNSNANTYDGTCRYPNVTVSGCTDPSATNYNSNATVNNGSCTYPQYTHYVAPPASNSGSNELPQNNQAPTNGTSPSGLSGLFSVYLPLAQVQKLDLKPFIGFGESTSKNSFSFVPFFEKFLFTPVASTTLGLSDAPELKAYLASLGITYDRDLVSLSKKLVAATTTRDIPGFYKVTSGSLKIKTANGGFASQDLVVTPYFTSDAVVPLGESVTLYSKDTITVSVIPTTKAKVSAKFNGKALSFEQTGKAVTVDITVPETSGRYILTTNASPLPLLIRAEKSKLVELPVPVSYKDKGLFGWIASFF
jgi:hypothetical protein